MERRSGTEEGWLEFHGTLRNADCVKVELVERSTNRVRLKCCEILWRIYPSSSPPRRSLTALYRLQLSLMPTWMLLHLLTTL